ncbi:MAG TPA: MarR family transcriptional regulator [Blastocatellia bacterium]|nr:MarR family transcriptional regulator [Blastocatellia bacterium]
MPKVKIPNNTAEQALIKLMRVGDRLWRESDERFSAWGLTDNHYNVLRILNGAGEPLSQIEIGRRMLSSRANVTKLIDLLEAKKFARRMNCEDRRMKLIELTEAGAKFIEDSLKQVLEAAETSLKPLTKTEQKTLGELLDKLLH